MGRKAVDGSAQLKTAFLADFRVWGNISRACRVSGASRTSIYDWQEHDPDFSALFKIAREEALESLEEEARRRAVEGVQREKPIVSQGDIIGYQTEIHYSDTLLIFLMKGLAPHKYRDNAPTPPPGNKVGLNQLRELVGIAIDDQEDAARSDT